MSSSKKDDTTNPLIARILEVKRERLNILRELNKQYEEELAASEDIPLKSETKKKEPRKKKEESPATPIPVRRSTRSRTSTPFYKLDDDFDDSDNESPSSFNRSYHNKSFRSLTKPNKVRPPQAYGPMPDIEVGHHWETRLECSYDGVHRPTVAGINPGYEGAYSIALSGGYPEDVDEGDIFTYTGAGGRDLKGTKANPKNLRTAPQTKDQQLEGVNLSLVKSIETRNPIRVIRGYKSPGPYAPESGYRYDGLYTVVRYWEDVGKTGFRVYRFQMERLEDQDPPPWETKKKNKVRRRGTLEDYFGEEAAESKAPSDLGLYRRETDDKSMQFISQVSARIDNSESDHELIVKEYEDIEKIDEDIEGYLGRLSLNSNDSSGISASDYDESAFQGWD